MMMASLRNSPCRPETRFLTFPYRTGRLSAARVWIPLALIGVLLPVTTASATTPSALRLGLVKSLFRDVPDSVVQALLPPFSTLVHQHTGVSGKLLMSADAGTLAAQLDQGQMDLGMFQGYEFAWARQKYPKLKPLMIAINQQRYLTVHLVTRKGSKVADFDDLHGKRLSLPLRSGGHCHLVLETCCEKAGAAPDKFFAKIVRHANAEQGLDAVVRGDVDAAIVDSLALECYGTVKPGCLPKLQTVEKSATFPALAVVYRDGAVSQQTLEAFRKGMVNANKDPKSRGLMKLWDLTAFEPVPADFPAALDAIAKAFPAPAELAVKTADAARADGPEGP